MHNTYMLTFACTYVRTCSTGICIHCDVVHLCSEGEGEISGVSPEGPRQVKGGEGQIETGQAETASVKRFSQL